MMKNEEPKLLNCFRYRYFVKLANGRLAPAGFELGPTEDVYKKGDSKGVKPGKQGIIIDVVKGAFAKKFSCDVMVVIGERPVKPQAGRTGLT